MLTIDVMLDISVVLVLLDLNLQMVSQEMSVLKEDTAKKEQLLKHHAVLVNLMLSYMLLVVMIVFHVGQATIVQELHPLDRLINVRKLITAQQEQIHFLFNQLQESMLLLSNLNL